MRKLRLNSLSMGISAKQRFALCKNSDQIISQDSLRQSRPDQSADYCRDSHSDDYAKKSVDDRLRRHWLLRIEPDKGTRSDQRALPPKVSARDPDGEKTVHKKDEKQRQIHHCIIREKRGCQQKQGHAERKTDSSQERILKSP